MPEAYEDAVLTGVAAGPNIAGAVTSAASGKTGSDRFGSGGNVRTIILTAEHNCRGSIPSSVALDLLAS